MRQAAKKIATEQGYEVFDISTNRKLPSQWAQIKADWLIRNPRWDKGQYALVEWKLGEGTWRWSSEEQEQKYYEGAILVFWYLEDLESWIAADKRVRRN